MQLNRKVALVTGSSRGIGRAIAVGLAEAGADIAVNYHATDEGEAEETLRDIEALGRRVHMFEVDVSNHHAVQEMAKNIENKLGAVDILVNNAAIFLEDVPLWDITEEQWDRVFAVNVKGPLFVSQSIIPTMKARRSGAIVNVSSLGADVTVSEMGAYVSSKGALNALTRAMALEFAPWNIRVNAISPGHIGTPETVEWAAANPAREQSLQARIALGRLGKVEEVAQTAIFLASEQAGYITGQVIYVEGGLMTWQGLLA